MSAKAPSSSVEPSASTGLTLHFDAAFDRGFNIRFFQTLAAPERDVSLCCRTVLSQAFFEGVDGGLKAPSQMYRTEIRLGYQGSVQLMVWLAKV